MRSFARLPAADRAEVFELARQRSGLPLAIIEKDFWVCWMLERLWTSPFAPHLIFKGGTSLSKCFDLIQRFSEDIDIGLDRALLGFHDGNDPMAHGLTRNARNKRVEALKDAAQRWIETTFLDDLSASIRAELGEASAVGWSWDVEHDTDGMPKLRWNPPPSHATRRGAQGEVYDSYLNRGVLIEIGSRAAHWPASLYEVSSYAAQQIPEAFAQPSATICTLEAARTFWEKATILHVLHAETRHDVEAGKPARQRERFSRHCYDLHCIAKSAAGESAATDFGLLADVVKFKRTYFCSSKVKEAQYDDALPGTLRLVPHPALEDFLRSDYGKMQKSGMFFSAPPSWDDIRATLQETENRINGV